MANPTAKVDNIPKAPKAIPNIPKRVWQMNEVTANKMTGIIAETLPKAIPKIIFVAAPVTQASANSLTGLYE